MEIDMDFLFPNNPTSPAPEPLFFEPSSLYVWDKIKEELKKSLPHHEFQSWIVPLKNTENKEALTLFVPNMVFYHGLKNNYLAKIESLKNDLGFPLLDINIRLNESVATSSKEERQTPSFASSLDNFGKVSPLEDEDTPDETSIEVDLSPQFCSTLAKTPKLNPNYTFGTFVRGPSNQFALATCLNVAETPGLNYNPLFLYGSTGLGKTHLLHAVGNDVLKNHPNLVVTYISSERFMNEMIYCIRHNKMWDFRQKYRHCDVFMMDDIQFISGNKSATQEEFFHTFNSLYEAKKQIIITSDLFPQDIPDIEERLRNRFQWGLIADIQPPDVEHRIAILLTKAEKLGVHLKKDVAEYIATHAKKNIRELEGSLHRVAAFAALHGRTLDKKLAIEIFESMLVENTKTTDIELVQRIVADHFGLKVSDLKSKKRQRALTTPRQIAMYLSRKKTHSSYPEIGERFGGKDHTTVMHGVKKIELELTKNMELLSHIEALGRKIARVH